MLKRIVLLFMYAVIAVSVSSAVQAASVAVCGMEMDADTAVIDASVLAVVSGSAIYDAESGTLTLDNFVCRAEDTDCISYSGDLHIVVKGNCILSGGQNGISAAGNGNLTISGDGESPRMTIISSGVGICTYTGTYAGGLSIDRAEITVAAGGDGIDSGKAVIISDSVVCITSDHDGIEVESGGLSISGSDVKVVSAEDGFDVDGTAAEQYEIRLTDSKIDITCTVGQFSGYGIDYDTNTLTITRTRLKNHSQAGAFSPESSQPVLGSDAVFLSGGSYAEIFPVNVGASYGDVNGDGTFSAADGEFLSGYFQGVPVTVDIPAADIDGDGTVARRDSMILSRYLAGWKGYYIPVRK